MLKLTHERDGFVIEPAREGLPLRIEWGPSQRPYLSGMELRLRGETGIEPHVYGALMPQGQLETLERALFEQSTDSVQTRFDGEMPEEMRWLAMGERLDATQLGPLRGDFAGVANQAQWMAEWLAGPTGDALHGWAQAELQRLAATARKPGSREKPAALGWALLVHRSRLVWRQSLAAPDAAAIASARRAFQVALLGARGFASHPLPSQMDTGQTDPASQQGPASDPPAED
ncbi:hypothetical protein [Ideonella sp.]|uniref:hypothetical protein n=1 Tax=Ideonella sp. TaxID=1929293 RepID=UPI002D7E4D05|nr:hypothetical protein [Ideonella sp.]